jgi:HEAT repeat protein
MAPDDALVCPECGQMLEASEADQAISELAQQVAAALGSNSQVRDEIGRGGFAVVFKVYDQQLDRELAVKALLPELAALRDTATRFRHEARTAARLNHPNILPIYFVGEEGGTPCYAMPLVVGETLKARIGREGRLTPADTVKLLRDVAAALDHAHAAGVIHRDVKPENVLLEFSSDRAMLMDFGIAKALERDASLTASGVLIGTPYYMSPEQVMGQRDLDARSDVYSLGIMVYEMLVGEPPFGGLNAQVIISQHVTEQVPDLAAQRPDLSPALARCVARALAKTPEERYQSAGAFADEMAGALGGERGSDATTVMVESGEMAPALDKNPHDSLLVADGLAGYADLASEVVTRAKAAAERHDAGALVEAVDWFAVRLDDKHLGLKQAVVNGLRRLGKDEAVVTLLAAAWRNGDDQMRAIVEKSLPEMLPDAAAALVKLARRDKSPEYVALADRVGALDDRYVESFVSDPSVSVVQAFAKGLTGSTRPMQEVERWLTQVARHPNAGLRAVAAEVAGARGGQLAERMGRQLLADDDLSVRVAALRAVGASRRRDAVPELARVLEQGETEEQVAAAEALGVLGARDVVPVLRRVFERKRMLRLERGPVQHAAARALAALPQDAGRGALEPLADDKDPTLRAIVAEALQG